VAKVSFTVERVANYQFEDDLIGKNKAKKMQSLLWDAKTPGLGVRATRNGAKSYIFETHLHGSNIRMTIGDTRAWTVGQAQAEAMRLQVLVDRGVDPRQERAAKRMAAEVAKLDASRKIATVGQAWAVYIATRKSKWGKRSYDDHVRLAAPGGMDKKLGEGKTIAGPLAELMPLLLSDLTADRVTQWLEKEKITRPTSAALAFRLLRAFLNWTADVPDFSGLVPNEICRSRAVREALPKNNAKEGDCLQREQLRTWFGAVIKISSPVVRTYLLALLLTGARREEMATLRWTDVDLTWRSINIRDKVEGMRTIPLPAYLATQFQMLKEMNEAGPTQRPAQRPSNTAAKEWKPSPWVFPSATAKSGRLTEPRIAHNDALRAAGLPHITLHGLRRSFSTLSEWVEMPAGVCAQLMGHKPSAISERHYRRRALDLLRNWHDRLEKWILTESGMAHLLPEQRDVDAQA
jgi:site-specific recombinase XerD